MLIDDLNIVFIVLNTFVGFTTSIFSATTCLKLEASRLTPVYLRFYHAMYPDHDVRHGSRVRVEQYRPAVGGGRTGR